MTKRPTASKALDIVARIFALATGIGLAHLLAGVTWRADLSEAREGLVGALLCAAIGLFFMWLADLVERAR